VLRKEGGTTRNPTDVRPLWAEECIPNSHAVTEEIVRTTADGVAYWTSCSVLAGAALSALRSSVAGLGPHSMSERKKNEHQIAKMGPQIAHRMQGVTSYGAPTP
jgi:hypothetical protein